MPDTCNSRPSSLSGDGYEISTTYQGPLPSLTKWTPKKSRDSMPLRLVSRQTAVSHSMSAVATDPGLSEGDDGKIQESWAVCTLSSRPAMTFTTIPAFSPTLEMKLEPHEQVPFNGHNEKR